MNLPSDPVPPRVVTLRSLLRGNATEAALLEDAFDARDPKGVELYQKTLATLQNETEQAGPNVLVTVQDPYVSMVQSRIAEHGSPGPELQAGGLEAMFGEGVAGGDIWGWFRSVFDHVSKREWHPIVRPSDAVPEAIADCGRVAVVGDWGTNLYGAPVSAATIARTGPYEALLHLGDVYYSGTESEVQQRFLQPWPKAAGRISRALNGNHEMYSGGYAYFDHVLPNFGQASSYFALQNQNWLLVGLDTAHSDHDLDAEQVGWLEAVVQAGGRRKLVLFSHHQPFSMLDAQGPKLQTVLAALLKRRAITAWYWGHEHNCVVYDPHPRFGLRGRCIGHGGIPSPRKRDVTKALTELSLNAIEWKRIAARDDIPSCLVLDGPNPLIRGEEQKFGPHGYLTLEFLDDQMIERVHLPEGIEIWRALVT